MQNNKDIVISDSIDVMTDLNLKGCNVIVNITDVDDSPNRVKNVFNYCDTNYFINSSKIQNANY